MKGLKNLFKWVKPVILLLLIVCIFQVINPLTYSYVPQFIKYIFDYILDNTGASNTLPEFLKNFFAQYTGIKAAMAVALTLIAYQSIRAIMLFTNGYVKGVMAETISYNIRTKLYKHIQDLPTNYHNTVDTGDLIQRCTSDIELIKNTLSNQIPELLYIITSFLSGALQMSAINPNITYVTLALLPLTLLLSIIYFKYISKQFDITEQEEANMTQVLQENVNGVRVVKAFNQEKYEIEKFNEKSNKFKKASFKVNRAMSIYWGVSDGLAFLQYAITIGYCILLAEKGSISSGDIVACLMYISMVIYPIRGLGRIIGDFGKSIIASKRIDEVLALDDEYKINGELKPEIKGNIEFSNVHFQFDDASEELLKGISFEIKSGETIAVVGKTGSGKSTIASLLVRMREYTSGSIKLDGVELKDIDKHYLRENIGIILQEPFLYAKSVYENIKIANKNLEEEHVHNAAKTAKIHDDILAFDKGYETLVGEKGVTLSGGQKQRVAIARMLVLNKPILIFDDSLSAVDTKTDLQIRNALKNENSLFTSIIITHRITTAKEANKIIVIEDGKISAIGTHEELASKEGLYKTLWDIQGALESEFIDLVDKEVSE